METTLSLQTLPLPKEKTYFTTAAILSGFLWFLIVISLVGILYAALGALIAWIANGLLIARIKSESVKIDGDQYPELFQTYTEVCARRKVAQVPALYILQAGGVLNAFATRHSGRNFVVIHSSFLEATGPSSPQIKFLIGHELGHIQRDHLMKHLLLLPAALVPMIGEAYRRACEATCDRFGNYAANDLEGSTRALLILGAGREGAVHLDPTRFAMQYFADRGFFISWHELNSYYPTLSHRVAKIIGLHYPEYARTAERNGAAYVCAFLFTWRTILIVYIVFVILISLGGAMVPQIPPH